MKLVPYPLQALRPDEPVPLGLYEANGRLLLAAGQRLRGREHFDELKGLSLFAQEHEAADYQRRVAAAMDQKLRQGAALKEVVQARPDAAREAAPRREPSLAEQWLELTQPWTSCYIQISIDVSTLN